MGKDKQEVNPEKMFRERNGNHEVFYNETSKKYFAVSIDTSRSTANFSDLEALYNEIKAIDDKNRADAAVQNQKEMCGSCTKFKECKHREQVGCTESEIETNAGNPFLMF